MTAINISLIILANTTSEEVFNMTNNCINSFLVSVNKAKYNCEIILVESNLKTTFSYDFEHLKIITPRVKFNFHKFLNIGVENSKGTTLILSNNDVIYDSHFVIEYLKVKSKNPSILSFSPYDESSNNINKGLLHNEFILGYEIQKHLTGWSLIVDKSVLRKIGKLDERFNFYYADNDYSLMLLKYNIKHALLCAAKAKHLEGKSSKNNITKFDYENSSLYKDIPNYVLKSNMYWVLENKKMIEGIIKFHEKWGGRKSLKIKVWLANIFVKFNIGFLNKFVMFHK